MMLAVKQIAQAGVVSLPGLIIAAILFIAVNTLFDGSVPGARVDLTRRPALHVIRRHA